jgi:hypothetical protein
MYLCEGREVAKPDSAAGLYISSRPGKVVKVTIPDDHIAYQVSVRRQEAAAAAAAAGAAAGCGLGRRPNGSGPCAGPPGGGGGGRGGGACSPRLANAKRPRSTCTLCPRPAPTPPARPQVGEAMQIQSGGLLRATPHCVRGPSTRAALRTSRNTLAVFMQPDPTSRLLAPPGAAAADVGVEGFQPGMTFGGPPMPGPRLLEPAAPAHDLCGAGPSRRLPALTRACLCRRRRVHQDAQRQLLPRSGQPLQAAGGEPGEGGPAPPRRAEPRALRGGGVMRAPFFVCRLPTADC